jgi:hypothetical protein
VALLALHAFPTLYCRHATVSPGTPTAAILTAHGQEVRGKLASMPAWRRALLICAWPPAMVLLALALTVKNGWFIARRYHRGVVKQLVAQLFLMFSDGIPPIYFYVFELHEPGNYARAHEYIHRGYLKKGTLYKRLYSACPEREQKAGVLGDKLAFYHFCMEHNLPTARLFGIAEHGICKWLDHGKTSPPASLFVKPREGKGGHGTERWIWSNGTYSDGKSLLDSNELTARLSERSRRRSSLIHECLLNHPEIHDLTAGAVSTLRMYTCWNERDEVEHLFSMLRMSCHANSIVDNVCQGGVAAMVDVGTGRLGQATDGSTLARTGWLDRHPVTGAQILGRSVPFWQEALDVVISGHRALDAAIFVGWDVSITELGPVIVEGNKQPDITIEQRLSGPWGNQRFGEVLVHHLTTSAQTSYRGAAGKSRS